jgi:hypothetical protein
MVAPANTPATEAAKTDAFNMLIKKVRDGQDKAAAAAAAAQQTDIATPEDTAARRRFNAWINGNNDDTDGSAATTPQDQQQRGSILDLMFVDPGPEIAPTTPKKPFQPAWRPPTRPFFTQTENDDDSYAPGS